MNLGESGELMELDVLLRMRKEGCGQGKHQGWLVDPFCEMGIVRASDLFDGGVGISDRD